MTTLNDSILAATGGPTVNEGLAAWFGKLTFEALQDAERRWLVGLGGVPGSNQDMWLQVFGPGHINDIKFAYWSGNSQLGPELVTNGGFDTDTDWTKGLGWTIANGVATGVPADASGLSQALGLVDTTIYRLRYTLFRLDAGTVNVVLGGSGGAILRTATGTFIEDIASGPSGSLGFNKDIAFNGDIDDVSMREVL